MELTQIQTLQSLCEHYEAYGCEVWFVGIRFYLPSGKMSKIVSKKGLNLETGTVWINHQQFKNNVIKFRKRHHPDTHPKDPSWSNRLYKFVEQSLLSFDDPSDRYGSVYNYLWNGVNFDTPPKATRTEIWVDCDESVDERKARRGKFYRQF